MDLRFAYPLCLPIIYYGGLKLSPAWLSVPTAEILQYSICNWPCTVFASFAFSVAVVSLISTDLVSPPYLFVRDIFYRALYYVVLILSASGNLCHSLLVKSYDGWTSNCDLSLHCTIRESFLMRLWFPLPPWPIPDLPLPCPPDLPLQPCTWYLPLRSWNILPLTPSRVPASFILLVFLLLLDDS